MCLIGYKMVLLWIISGLLKATKPADIDRTITKLFAVHEYQLEQAIKKVK